MRYVLPSLLLIVLGAAAPVLIDGTAGAAIAILLIGIGCVVAVSTLFWRVGESEDRDREAGG